MREFKVFMETPYAGISTEEIFEMPDDATEEEIEKEASELFHNLYGFSWREKEGESDEL